MYIICEIIKKCFQNIIYRSFHGSKNVQIFKNSIIKLFLDGRKLLIFTFAFLRTWYYKECVVLQINKILNPFFFLNDSRLLTSILYSNNIKKLATFTFTALLEELEKKCKFTKTFSYVRSATAVALLNIRFLFQ